MNKNKSEFGGEWTKDKLNRIKKYLELYMIALKKFKFSKIYIDGFAGNGNIFIPTKDGLEKIDGSVLISLNLENRFDRYYFIEKDKQKYEELLSIKDEYSTKGIKIKCFNANANQVIQEACANTNWERTRGIIFLDPFALSLEWRTLEAISKTQVLDCWIYFSISALMRMLPKDGVFDSHWLPKINTLFGCSSWKEDLYQDKGFEQLSLLEGTTFSSLIRKDEEAVYNYVISRLETIFPYVSRNYLILRNSKNTPIFLLIFAMSNHSKNAINLGKRLSSYILEK